MPELTTPAQAREALEYSRTVAVLGVSDKRHKAAFYVPDYLHDVGYRVLPVNATRVGQRMWGETVVARLDELREPVDMVDVFRRGPLVAEHVQEILNMKPLPKVVWLQLGIRNDEATSALVAAGIDVVQDRCTLADHRRFGLGAPREGAPGISPDR